MRHRRALAGLWAILSLPALLAALTVLPVPAAVPSRWAGPTADGYATGPAFASTLLTTVVIVALLAAGTALLRRVVPAAWSRWAVALLAAVAWGAVAAALVHDPDILVLDEPFSGLDPLAVDVVVSAIAEHAARGVPVLFSSHQLEVVERLCDRVAIINEGRVEQVGTPDQLYDEPANDFVMSFLGEVTSLSMSSAPVFHSSSPQSVSPYHV